MIALILRYNLCPCSGWVDTCDITEVTIFCKVPQHTVKKKRVYRQHGWAVQCAFDADCKCWETFLSYSAVEEPILIPEKVERFDILDFAPANQASRWFLWASTQLNATKVKDVIGFGFTRIVSSSCVWKRNILFSHPSKVLTAPHRSGTKAFVSLQIPVCS